MTLLATLLAVVIFTESQAVLLSDEPRSELTELKEELKEYMRNISNAVNEKQLLMRRSGLGQQLEHYLQDNFVQAKRRWNKLQRELPSEMFEGYNLAATLPIAVGIKTYAALLELRGKLEPAVEELYDLLNPILAPYTTPFLKTMRPHAKTLSAMVQEVDANLNQNLKSNLDTLATWLVPYAQTIRSQWGKFQKSLGPFTNQVQEQLRQGVDVTKGSWQPFVAPVQKAFRQYAKMFYDFFLKD